MKYFVAIEEDLLQQLWQQDPSLVVPFSRPFCPNTVKPVTEEIRQEVQALLPAPKKETV